MRQLFRIMFITFASLVVVSCGTSSTVGEDDIEKCNELLRNATVSIRALSSWIAEVPSIEGTRSGYDAARDMSFALSETASLAEKLSAESSSGNTKKVFGAISKSYSEAGVSIYARGGSIGPEQEELFKNVSSASEDLAEYCAEN